jgi:hypothetical protein
MVAWLLAIVTGAEFELSAVPLALTLFGEIETTRALSAAVGADEAPRTAATTPALPMATVPLESDVRVPDEITTVPLVSDVIVPPVMDETATVPRVRFELGERETTKAGSVVDGAVFAARTEAVLAPFRMATTPLDSEAIVPDETLPTVVMVPPVIDETTTVPLVSDVTEPTVVIVPPVIEETATVPLVNDVTEPIVVIVPPVIDDTATLNGMLDGWTVMALAAGVPATAATALRVITVPVVAELNTPVEKSTDERLAIRYIPHISVPGRTSALPTNGVVDATVIPNVPSLTVGVVPAALIVIGSTPGVPNRAVEATVTTPVFELIANVPLKLSVSDQTGAPVYVPVTVAVPTTVPTDEFVVSEIGEKAI